MKFWILKGICVLLTLSYSMQAQSNIKSYHSPVVYEIFIQSFCDSNGDGIGDLNGIYSKLDYLRDLGITTIWLTPFHPSPSYHKYDVSDYRAVHKDYGTMADLQKLIFGVHQRNMKIMMDLVINHTSAEHPWFKASSSSPTDPHRNYYVWKDYEEVKDELEKKKTTFDSDNLTQWHEWPGQSERYYGFFWKGMPDLNFDHPEVRKEVYDVAKFWIDKGFDGFRMDAARHIYPDDQLEDTKAFWGEFKQVVESYKPDIEIVGEVWAEPEVLAYLFSSLPALFNFELSKSIRESIISKNADQLVTTIKEIQSVYPVLDTTLRDAILLSNHDMNRIGSELNGNTEQLKLAASILLSYPGTPYIYYGEELGMLGKKPDEGIREPFLWDSTVWNKKWWHEIEHTVEGKIEPLDKQIKNSASLFNHYKTWLKWRKDYKLGDARITSIQSPYPGVIKMDLLTRRKENIRIYHNLNDTFIVIPVDKGNTIILPATIKNKAGEIRLEKYQSGIVKL